MKVAVSWRIENKSFFSQTEYFQRSADSFAQRDQKRQLSYKLAHWIEAAMQTDARTTVYTDETTAFARGLVYKVRSVAGGYDTFLLLVAGAR